MVIASGSEDCVSAFSAVVSSGAEGVIVSFMSGYIWEWTVSDVTSLSSLVSTISTSCVNSSTSATPSVERGGFSSEVLSVLLSFVCSISFCWSLL